MKTMRHSLRVSGPRSRDGRPTFTGLGSVMATIGTAARDATCMRFRHASRIQGRRPDWLREVSDLNPVGIEEAGDHAKVVVVEAPVLGDAAKELYTHRGLFDTFPDQSATALDVLGETVGVIAEQNAASEWYDTDLLKRLEKFGKMFREHSVESVALNGASLSSPPRAVITSDTVAAAAALHRKAPKPTRVRIAGKLDMLRDSDRAFDLILASGERVRGIWEEELGPIITFLTKRVVVDGMAVFRASGSLLRIEAGAMAEAGAEDEFFSRLPTPSVARFDLRDLHQVQGVHTGLNAVFGRWPGDESEDQLLAALKEHS